MEETILNEKQLVKLVIPILKKYSQTSEEEYKTYYRNIEECDDMIHMQVGYACKISVIFMIQRDKIIYTSITSPRGGMVTTTPDEDKIASDMIKEFKSFEGTTVKLNDELKNALQEMRK